MPIIKFVNESEKIEYSTEQDVCSLLCYAFDPQKTIMNDNQFVGCKPFGFPFWYMRNPLAVHQFMEFNHKRQFKHRKDLAKHRVISFSKEENLWGDRIFEKCGIRRDEGGDGGKTLEIRGKRRLSARDGGANYQQS